MPDVIGKYGEPFEKVGENWVDAYGTRLMHYSTVVLHRLAECGQALYINGESLDPEAVRELLDAVLNPPESNKGGKISDESFGVYMGQTRKDWVARLRGENGKETLTKSEHKAIDEVFGEPKGPYRVRIDYSVIGPGQVCLGYSGGKENATRASAQMNAAYAAGEKAERERTKQAIADCLYSHQQIAEKTRDAIAELVFAGRWRGTASETVQSLKISVSPHGDVKVE